jgi:SlyX protein
MMSAQQTELSRLDELESRAAFQDDLIENLNRVIARQDRELADLARRVRDLEAKLSDLAEAASPGGSGGGHEVPPHY